MNKLTNAVSHITHNPKHVIFRIKCLCALAGLALATVITAAAFAQAVVEPSAGLEPKTDLLVPLTHGGPYIMQAKMVMDLLKKGDYQNAAVAATVLEVVWDQNENGMKAASSKRWTAIDESMDNFLGPIKHHVTKGDPVPDAAKLETPYNQYLKNLEELNNRFYR